MTRKRTLTGVVAAALAATLALALAPACMNYVDEDYEGTADLTPGTMRLKGFSVSSSGVDPVECYSTADCPGGYECYDGSCVPAAVGTYCNAVIYCVCPMVATEYPTCASDAATMGESSCYDLLVSSFPTCMP